MGKGSIVTIIVDGPFKGYEGVIVRVEEEAGLPCFEVCITQDELYYSRGLFVVLPFGQEDLNESS